MCCVIFNGNEPPFKAKDHAQLRSLNVELVGEVFLTSVFNSALDVYNMPLAC